MIDLWTYLSPDTEAGSLAGRPVGVTQTPGGDAIHQAQRDASAPRRVFHVKGSFGAPCDWEELYADGDFICRAIDTSRPATDGGPYTLHDSPVGRGSKWVKRIMAVGDVFERSPYVSAFDMATGARKSTAGPVRTWLRLAKQHASWRGVSDVVELHWLTESPTQATAKEKYFYGKGLGLVGFEGPGLTTVPNHVWEQRPPAAGVPVLARKPIGFTLPALPEQTPPASDAGDFFLLHPCHSFNYFQWDNFGERLTPEPDDGAKTEWHPGLDITFAAGALPPYPITAANAGRVVLAGWDTSGYGNLVKIDHGGQRETLYAHLESIDAAVKPGAQVGIGQRLGNMGYTGRVVPQGEKGRHLHFEYRVNGVGVDPAPLLRDTIAAPVPEPQPEPEPTPEPTPDAGLLALHLTIDEARQFQAALVAERDAKNEQIRILAAALARAGAA